MKEIVSYVYGSFNDYKGVEHKIIVCGITTRYKNDEGPQVITYDENEFEYYIDVEKVLTIGVAICNPIDVYDSEKGETIAYSRAKSEESIIMTTSRPGMFNTETVMSILNNYLHFIEKDPGSVINGYDESVKKFKLRADLADDVNKMTEEQKQFIKKLANVTPEGLEYAKKLDRLGLL